LCIALWNLLTLPAGEVRPEGVRVHEFVAVNANSLLDEDRDSSAPNASQTEKPRIIAVFS
jgi:hypothetical protein